MSGIGLEHHRSSENGVGVKYFTGWDPKSGSSDLLAHEYNHSWDGKYRRGADLTTPSFNTPMQGSLLWVYEGQTQYWGNVITARAGLRNFETAKDALALVAATYAENRAGLSWRALQDTTNDPIIAKRTSKAYRSWQLSEDYYSGGQMIWLEVDARLREKSNNKVSLDDFAKKFFGMNDGDFKVNPYTFDDVAATLNAWWPTTGRRSCTIASTARCRSPAASKRQRLEARVQGQAECLREGRRRPNTAVAAATSCIRSASRSAATARSATCAGTARRSRPASARA